MRASIPTILAVVLAECAAFGQSDLPPFYEIKPDTVCEQKINQHGKRAASIVKGMPQHISISKYHSELTNINALVGEYLRFAYHGLRTKSKSFGATTKPAVHLTGFGLSLAYDIIWAHGGELKVNTKEGEGLAFIIQLQIT